MTQTVTFPTQPLTNTTTSYQISVADTANPNVVDTQVMTQGGQYKYDGTTGQAPEATKQWSQLVTLTAGAATLDLTALTNPVRDMSGLKLLELFAIAHEDNANVITIAPGASNGFTGWVGSAGLRLLTALDQNKIGPLYGGITVDGTHKTIDIAGTGTQKVLISMLFGP